MVAAICSPCSDSTDIPSRVASLPDASAETRIDDTKPDTALAALRNALPTAIAPFASTAPMARFLSSPTSFAVCFACFPILSIALAAWLAPDTTPAADMLACIESASVVAIIVCLVLRALR